MRMTAVWKILPQRKPWSFWFGAFFALWTVWPGVFSKFNVLGKELEHHHIWGWPQSERSYLRKNHVAFDLGPFSLSGSLDLGYFENLTFSFTISRVLLQNEFPSTESIRTWLNLVHQVNRNVQHSLASNLLHFYFNFLQLSVITISILIDKIVELFLPSQIP